MEELARHSPEAHARLAATNADPEHIALLAQGISQLSHGDLYASSENDLVGSSHHELIPATEFDSNQHEQQSRVGGMMSEAARLTSMAAEQLAATPEFGWGAIGDGLETGVPKEAITFGLAKEIALQEAKTLHEAGDQEAAGRALENMLVLDLLQGLSRGEHSDSTSDRSMIHQAVRVGMAEELVGALGNLHGVAAISTGRDEALSVSHRVEAIAGNLLRVASGRNFDDQFQHQEQLVRPGQPREDIEHRSELIGSLDAIELDALAQEASERKRNPEYAAHLSLQALRVIESRMERDSDPKEVAGVISRAASRIEAVNRPELIQQAEQALVGLRANRSAGYKPFRTNLPVAGLLDAVIVSAAVSGDKKLVTALISSSPHELAPSGAPEEDKGQYNLDYAIENYSLYTYSEETGGIELSTEQKQVARELLVEAQKAKIQQLTQQLEQKGASQEQIEIIIRRSSDPDSSLGAPDEFWQISDLSQTEQEMVLGEWSYDIGTKAEFIVNTRNLGLDSSFISGELETEIRTHHVGKEKEFLESLSKVVSELQTQLESTEYEDAYDAQETIRALTDFEDPYSALTLVKIISNGRLTYGDVSKLKKITHGSGYRDRWNQAPLQLSSEFAQSIQRAANSAELSRVMVKTTDEQIRTQVLETLIKSHDIALTTEELGEVFSSDAFGKFALDDGVDVLSRRILVDRALRSEDMKTASQDLYSIVSNPDFQKAFLATDSPGFQIKQMVLDNIVRLETNEDMTKAAREISAAFLHTDLSKITKEAWLGGRVCEALFARVASGANRSMFEVAQEVAGAMIDTGLRELIDESGEGYGLRDAILRSVLESDNIGSTATSIVAIFRGGGSLWHTTSQLAELSVQDSFYSENAKVSEIPLSLPVRSKARYDPEAIQYAKGDEMLQQLHDLYGVSESVIEAARASGGQIAVADLPPELQTTLLTAYLYEAITISRDSEAKTAASERNRSVQAEQLLVPGNLHHFSSPDYLGPVLQNGLLPGEFVAGRQQADAYPFNVDLVESTPEVSSLSSYSEQLEALASSRFGGMCVHLIRGEIDDARPGAEFSAGVGYKGQHRLVPGGLPATEISAVTVKDENSLQTVRTALLEAGMFIPVFNAQGESIYSYEDYQTDRVDGNYDTVQPEVVDLKFERPESQAGSNEGAEFIVPSQTPGQAPTRYYVKFAKPEGAEHLWSELLADSLYRTVAPELVPETSAVIVEGRLARASKMVELDTEPVTSPARNAGFLMDCLVGNWDATYNSANLVMSGRVAMRVDTGNALFFRARGNRKDEGAFGEVVTELESGSSVSQLGTGMRQNYPELTVDEVRSQATAMRERLTDEQVDTLLDAVRMTGEERVLLKKTLRARRDYILQWAAEIESGSRTL